MSNKERRLNLTIHTYLIYILKRKARVAYDTLLGGGT